MTVTIEDTDISHLFDEVVSCDGTEDEDCPNEAEWVLTRPCCHHSVLLCTEHKEAYLEWVKTLFIVICALCGKTSVIPRYNVEKI